AFPEFVIARSSRSSPSVSRDCIFMREPLACLPDGTVLVSLSDLFESPRNAHVKRIWPVDICGTITPMLVHPEPRGGGFSHVRLERIPACLRNLSMCHFGRLFDLWVEDHPIGAGW